MTERHRRRSNESTAVGFAVPTLLEVPSDAQSEPLVVTNAVGDLVLTRRSVARSCARYGFFECPSGEEHRLLPRFFSALWILSQNLDWNNRCTSLSEASVRMHLPFRSLVVPYSLVEQASGERLSREDADALMAAQGYIADRNGQQILVADLEDGQALLAAAPALVGIYTRIDDWLGVMLQRVDRSVCLVDSRAGI